MNTPEILHAGISDQARDWVLRLASGEMDAGELDQFKRWIAADAAHARAFDQRRSLWLALGEHPEVFPQTAVPALPPLRESAGSRRRFLPRLTRLRPRRRVAATGSLIAASLLAILAGPEALLRLEADHRTSSQVAQYQLADGSEAWLDAGSAISVDYTDQERRITLLRGNAYFTVAHGEPRPFRVAALDGVVEDIGTSFEVRRQPQQVDVAVTEGAVRVAGNKAMTRTITLREGQTARYDATGRLTNGSTGTPDAMAAWRREELMIDRQPLPAVIREIARYRSGPTWIWGDLDSREPVNGALRIDNADAALRDLAAVQGFRITWLPGGIAIIRNSAGR